MGKKVAIVGSGCAGIGALWALNHTDHEVHLYEASSRLGGHTNTVSFEGPGGMKTNVDTGFIVMNSATYPNFIAFLKEVGVKTKPSWMTFGVSRDEGKFEWAGTSLSSVFTQRKNVFSPRMWRMIFDIIRFNQFALDLLQDEDESENDPQVLPGRDALSRPVELSIGEYLEREGYSQAFRDDYLIPMTASVWSTNADKASLHFPAVTLVRFMWNHHLLSTISARPDWLTIPGGSKQYIDAVLTDFPKDRIHLKTTVTALAPGKNGAVTLTANQRDEVYDHVILATHGDEALRILKPVATKQEVEILSGFQTNRNIAVLHSDVSLMPKNRLAWSAWNYLTESPFPPFAADKSPQVCLTYWMNLLQHIPEETYGPVLVTLNPLTPPDPRLAQGVWEYAHPAYNAGAIRSQKLLPTIQNTRGISYCGAWTKYGFHEDGFSSGLSAAINHLGAQIPFDFVDSTFSRGRKPQMTWRKYLVRFVIEIIQTLIVLGMFFMARWYKYLDKQVAKRRKVP